MSNAHTCQLTDSRVVDSRTSVNGRTIRRRRQCACGQRFTTYEAMEVMTPVDFQHRDRVVAALTTALVAVRQIGKRNGGNAP